MRRGNRWQCHLCKQWIEEGQEHDCWTTTEAALTRDLPEELQDAWERLREAAAALGKQRIYASHHCIMFSRKVCYCFVRPKPNFLELCVFLGNELHHPLVRRVARASRTKLAHLIRITHRDQVEAPLIDWLRDAYDYSIAFGAATTRSLAGVRERKRKPGQKTAARKRGG